MKIPPLLIAFGYLTLANLLHGQGVYKPMPTTGFDFPADQNALLKMRDDKDVAAMRRHGWAVFAGLTQPARPNEADSEAIWETWYQSPDVFGPAGPSLQSAKKKRVFTPLRQSQIVGAAPQATGQSVASFTLFNQETKDHIRSNQYQMAQTKDDLNKNWPTGTAPKDRKIKDFPRTAMSLKTTWWVVKKNQKTGMYIWDEKPEADPAPNQAAPTWKRAIAIDPTRDQVPADEKMTIPIRGKDFPNSHVVPLKAFYYFVATEEDLPSLNNNVPLGASEDPNLGRVEVGDFLVLAALHYTTKEIPNWVWATFWWHDQPDKGPYGENRPDNTFLKGVWRNYKMDVAFDMTVPTEPGGKPNAVFNPWLEARFGNGVHSNCMTCHQLATWNRQDFSVTRGPLPDNDARFKNTTKTDFLWSIVVEGNQ